MSISQKATVTTTKEITLKPTTKRKLLTELKAYAALKKQQDEIDESMSVHKATIGELRESTGEDAIALDGFKVSLVSPVRKVLNHKKLIELGCAVAWIEEATESKPSKSYEKVSCPGEKEREYD